MGRVRQGRSVARREGSPASCFSREVLTSQVPIEPNDWINAAYDEFSDALRSARAPSPFLLGGSWELFSSPDSCGCCAGHVPSGPALAHRTRPIPPTALSGGGRERERLPPGRTLFVTPVVDPSRPGPSRLAIGPPRGAPYPPRVPATWRAARRGGVEARADAIVHEDGSKSWCASAVAGRLPAGAGADGAIGPSTRENAALWRLRLVEGWCPHRKTSASPCRRWPPYPQQADGGHQ